jgi:hypothetical protein
VGADRRKDDRTREVLNNIEEDWKQAIERIQSNYEALRRQLVWALRWVVAISLLLPALVVAGFLAYGAEQKARRDQACAISEAKQRRDIDSLRRTYDYLLTLSPTEKRDPINRAVLAGLPRTEADARLDDAPPYCDEPGIGEPEPDPTIPRRPIALG